MTSQTLFINLVSNESSESSDNDVSNDDDDIVFSQINKAFYLNLIIINKAYYKTNNKLRGPKKILCLKLGSVDDEMSKTDRNIDVRIKNHTQDYGAIYSIPLLICHDDKPRVLENHIKNLLAKNLKIICITGAKLVRPQEFYPLSSEIIETIKDYITDNDIDLIYENDLYTKSDELSNLCNIIWNNNNDLTLLKSLNNSLTSIQLKKLTQNSILKTY